MSPPLNYFHNKQPLVCARQGEDTAHWFVISIRAPFSVVCVQIMCYQTHCSHYWPRIIKQTSSFLLTQISEHVNNWMTENTLKVASYAAL